MDSMETTSQIKRRLEESLQVNGRNEDDTLETLQYLKDRKLGLGEITETGIWKTVKHVRDISHNESVTSLAESLLEDWMNLTITHDEGATHYLHQSHPTSASSKRLTSSGNENLTVYPSPSTQKAPIKARVPKPGPLSYKKRFLEKTSKIKPEPSLLDSPPKISTEKNEILSTNAIRKEGERAKETSTASTKLQRTHPLSLKRKLSDNREKEGSMKTSDNHDDSTARSAVKQVVASSSPITSLSNAAIRIIATTSTNSKDACFVDDDSDTADSDDFMPRLIEKKSINESKDEADAMPDDMQLSSENSLISPFLDSDIDSEEDDEELYECEKCQKPNLTNKKLKAHHVNLHVIANRICPFECPKTPFDSALVLDYHLKGSHRAQRGLFTEVDRNCINFKPTELDKLRPVMEEIGIINESQQDLEILEKRTFIVAFNKRTRMAAYVVEQLEPSSEITKSFSRKNFEFVPDADIKEQLTYPVFYYYDGMEIGHLASAGNNKYSLEGLKDSFLFINAVVMMYEVNKGAWKTGENLGRLLVQQFWDKVISICGPIFKKENKAELIEGRFKVKVPDSFFRIYILKKENVHPRLLAFIIPNDENVKPLWNYVVTLDDIKEQTGIRFLTKLKAIPCGSSESLSMVIPCPKPNCGAVFISQSDYDKHLSLHP